MRRPREGSGFPGTVPSPPWISPQISPEVSIPLPLSPFLVVKMKCARDGGGGCASRKLHRCSASPAWLELDPETKLGPRHPTKPVPEIYTSSMVSSVLEEPPWAPPPTATAGAYFTCRRGLPHCLWNYASPCILLRYMLTLISWVCTKVSILRSGAGSVYEVGAEPLGLDFVSLCYTYLLFDLTHHYTLGSFALTILGTDSNLFGTMSGFLVCFPHGVCIIWHSSLSPSTTGSQLRNMLGWKPEKHLLEIFCLLHEPPKQMVKIGLYVANGTLQLIDGLTAWEMMGLTARVDATRMRHAVIPIVCLGLTARVGATTPLRSTLRPTRNYGMLRHTKNVPQGNYGMPRHTKNVSSGVNGTRRRTKNVPGWNYGMPLNAKNEPPQRALTGSTLYILLQLQLITPVLQLRSPFQHVSFMLFTSLLCNPVVMVYRSRELATHLCNLLIPI